MAAESTTNAGIKPQADPSPEVLVARELHKHYESGEGTVRALDGLNIEIAAGQFVAVMGASGSGKSTFMHLAGGLDTPTGGAIIVEGQDLAHLTDTQRTLFRRRRLGIIFQQFNLLPTLSAVENVALPSLVDGQENHAVAARAQELLGLVDLANRSSHRPAALSGGEQQRVAVARALMNNPAVVLADEPTGNLDSHHAVEIWQLLHNLAREHHKTIIMVTHDAQGASYADRICVLRDGKLLGELVNEGTGNAALVARRYQELVG
ncbi:MAG: Lipoprotein-releasing system ATP-binding protein LolD [Phycisphaerae bacterium]|nr:Lipoprotein-releasing system ATP-binding protein LolD [Phycisphaerae bacterium]